MRDSDDATVLHAVDLKPLELHIAKLTLAPDDVLVVKIWGRVTAAVMFEVDQYIAEVVPPGTRYLVTDASVELSVLTRAEIEARSDTASPAGPAPLPAETGAAGFPPTWPAAPPPSPPPSPTLVKQAYGHGVEVI